MGHGLKQYLLHKNGSIGVADIPEWLRFGDPKENRSFDVYWLNLGHRGITTTLVTTPVTKEVADIMRGV